MCYKYIVKRLDLEAVGFFANITHKPRRDTDKLTAIS